MPLSPDRPAQTPDVRHCLSEFLSRLTDPRPLGVAVSGGSDSLGLLVGLAGLCPPGRLVALTVDHGLRPGSADEARRVKALCRRLGLRHETLPWDGQKPASGLQASARQARYALLGSAAERHGLAAVLTGHTSDDQQETLAMRRARSLSDQAAGLAGIPRATLFGGRLWVLRPMLELPRAAIRGFLGEARVDWIDDPSNSDPRFERVRVRGLLAGAAPDLPAPDFASIAAARARLARDAAAHIEAHCAAEAGGLIRMRLRPEDDPELVAAVLEALIDLSGGAARPLDRRGKATLRAAVDAWTGPTAGEGQGRAVTLGRSLIRRRGADLLIARERRGIETLSLAPGASCVWDGRYRVRNLDGKSPLCIEGGGQRGVAPWFGRDLGGRLLHWSGENGVAGGFLCRRLTGRTSHVLPVHELPLAQALAGLAGCPSFPRCPWEF